MSELTQVEQRARKWENICMRTRSIVGLKKIKKKSSNCTFRSYDLRVMSPATQSELVRILADEDELGHTALPLRQIAFSLVT